MQQNFIYQADNNKGIYAQLDNFTIMVYHSTMQDVIEWLGLELESFIGDLYKSKQMIIYMNAYQFEWNGIRIQAYGSSSQKMLDLITHNNYLSGLSDDERILKGDYIDVFDVTLEQIRLELTGTGLRYLRDNVNKDIDNFLRNPAYKMSNAKVTRVDFAFDFINYMPGILDSLIEYAQAYCSDSGRVLTYKGCGYKCRVHTVGDKCMYLGSPQSAQMLRIYDKRLEQLDVNREVYSKPNPYDNPDSWIRFEFQLRDDKAHNMCYNLSTSADVSVMPTFYSIFRQLMKSYIFVDPNTTKDNRAPYEPLIELWDWEEIEPIIQNAKSNEDFVPYSEKLGNYVHTLIPLLALYLDYHGPQKIYVDIYNYLNSLYDPDNEYRYRQCSKFSMRQAMLDDYEHRLLSVNNGKYELNDKIKFLFLSSPDTQEVKEADHE